MSASNPLKGTSLKISHPLATITLSRPERHNAFNDQTIQELTSHLKQVEADSKIRVLLLKAEGKNFSAGADLSWMQKAAHYSKEQNKADALALATLLYNLFTLNKPSIAMVQGSAFGGAIGLIACCDIVLATSSAQFCFSEVKLGLVPAVISPFVITALGTRAASRYFLTAEPFGAKEAHQLNLVHEILSDTTELEKRSEQICHKLLNNGPQAIQHAKKLIRTVHNVPLDQTLLNKTAELIAELRVSQEGQEGIAAFLEKRPPRWIDVP